MREVLFGLLGGVAGILLVNWCAPLYYEGQIKLLKAELARLKERG